MAGQTKIIIDTQPVSLWALLLRGTPGHAGEYPVGCILPSFDDKHLDFSFQPGCVERLGERLIRAAFRGILFFFWIKEDAKDEELEPFHIRPDQNWVVPVVDWKDIDFLRHWVEAQRDGGGAARVRRISRSWRKRRETATRLHLTQASALLRLKQSTLLHERLDEGSRPRKAR